MATLQINYDKTMYYELIDGNPAKPYLVFLHEGLGCTAMWQSFHERLCRRTGCPGLAYDRSGYGRSSPGEAVRTVHYLHDYALNELPRILNGVIPERPYIVIGHSDGGSIGLIHGAERPPLLRGIIAEAAHVFVEPETIAGVRSADKAFADGRFKGLFRYHGEKTQRVFRAWSETWTSDWFRYWSIEYLLPSIRCPVLVVQGSEDRYGTMRQVQTIASMVSGPVETFVLERCGHVPHIEQPESVLERLAGWVASIVNAQH